MGLKAFMFKDDKALEAAASKHASHLLLGHTGAHVGKIQEALIMLDRAVISDVERLANSYGPSTAAAVLNYKTKRRIVNTSYQSAPDAVVGIMTMKALDDELFQYQQNADFTDNGPKGCGRPCGHRHMFAVNALKRQNTSRSAWRA